MQTLDLECPSCGEHLELDAGFAGGVCRCSNCGTLMTVPRDAGRAEQLAAPESGAEISDASMSATDLVDTPRPRTRQRAGSKKRGKKGKGRDTPRGGTIDAGEYRTASGKVVRVDAPIRVPMAQSKRKKIRVVTTVVFMSVVLGVAVIAAGAIWMMLNSGQSTGQDKDEDIVDTAPVYDPTANPFVLNFANLAGLPLAGKVSVVTEASKGESEFWMLEASGLITSGLRSGGEPAQVAFFAAAKGKAIEFEGGEHTTASQVDQSKLGDWLKALPFEKQVDRTAAIERALIDKPDMLILVFSGGKRAEIEAWDKLIDQKKQVVHAVLINSTSVFAVQEWLNKREGNEVVSISSGEIESWRELASETEDSEDSEE